MTHPDSLIIGGGPNGLVAATILAKRGLKPVVLEAADRVGGSAVTTEIAPGFRCPRLSHWAAFSPRLIAELELERHGLEIVASAAIGCVASAGDPALVLWRNRQRALPAIARASARDSARYPEFVQSVAAIARLLEPLLETAAPSIDAPGAGDLFELLKTGRRFRALGARDAHRALRWLPMPIADFVEEWFEHPQMQAAIATAGVWGSHLGPRSAGSTATFLLMAARHAEPMSAGWTARGGIGALTAALANAAQEAGATIRTSVRVDRILISEGVAQGVVLHTGEEIRAPIVASSADPKQTLLRLVDPVHLAPGVRSALSQIRMRGVLAKVNFAVSELPKFSGLTDEIADRAGALSGWIRLARDVNAIERAFDAVKYGQMSEHPVVDLAIPSVADRSLAPDGQHVVSACVQYAPYDLRGSTWAAEKERLVQRTIEAIEGCAPGFTASVIGREVLTPSDLEAQYGLTGGQIFHGELALDQLYLARPLLGWARYATPIRGLYLCGSGTHPGTGLDGRSGALAAREILKAHRR